MRRRYVHALLDEAAASAGGHTSGAVEMVIVFTSDSASAPCYFFHLFSFFLFFFAVSSPWRSSSLGSGEGVAAGVWPSMRLPVTSITFGSVSIVFRARAASSFHCSSSARLRHRSRASIFHCSSYQSDALAAVEGPVAETNVSQAKNQPRPPSNYPSSKQGKG